jgi:hypothetical protein
MDQAVARSSAHESPTTTTSEFRGERVTPLGESVTPLELAALELLTRQAGESYELYILRIAYARGATGRLARLIKLADLDDQMARPWVSGDPPYAWARRHIAVGCARAA